MARTGADSLRPSLEHRPAILLIYAPVSKSAGIHPAAAAGIGKHPSAETPIRTMEILDKSLRNVVQSQITPLRFLRCIASHLGRTVGARNVRSNQHENMRDLPMIEI